MTTKGFALRPALRRRIGLPLLVLYGTGITIGAGIYVLIGAVAGRAGAYSAWSFLLAAVVMALTVGSYAELATRYPVSAGEAAYVRAAFHSKFLSTSVGLLTFCTGIVTAAAVTLGSAGYIRQFIDLPAPLIVVGLVLILGAIATWGILESVVLAGLFTLVEAGGLTWIIASATYSGTPFGATLAMIPPLDLSVLSGISVGSLLAFFAFVGFEDLANVVEEAKVPHKNIPWAMTLTLVFTSVLYVLIAAISVTVVPPRELAASSAPLSLVFRTLTGVSPAAFNLIAVVATLNTILATMTMAARGDLWNGAARRSTGAFLGSSFTIRHTIGRYHCSGAGCCSRCTRLSDRKARGRHVACHFDDFCARQHLPASHPVAANPFYRSARACSDLGSGIVRLDLHSHDRQRAAAVGEEAEPRVDLRRSG